MTITAVHHPARRAPVPCRPSPSQHHSKPDRQTQAPHQAPKAIALTTDFINMVLRSYNESVKAAETANAASASARHHAEIARASLANAIFVPGRRLPCLAACRSRAVGDTHVAMAKAAAVRANQIASIANDHIDIAQRAANNATRSAQCSGSRLAAEAAHQVTTLTKQIQLHAGLASTAAAQATAATYDL